MAKMTPEEFDGLLDNEIQQAVTADRLRQLLDYCPATGVFAWRNRDLCEFNSLRAAMAFKASKAGKQAGTPHRIHGYRDIKVDGKSYKAHRLAWLHVHGEWPQDDIDHINGNRDDNRIANLRVVSPVENGRNKKLPSVNRSGVIGVRWHERLGKWVAQIKLLKRSYHLGLFASLDDAVAARKAAEIKHGFHANHGRVA